MSSDPELNTMDIDREILDLNQETKSDIFSKTRESGFKLDDRLRQIQKDFIVRALDEVNGNQTQAAKLLGINYQTLNKRVANLGIQARRPD